MVKETVNELEEKLGRPLPVDALIKAVEEKGVGADKAEEIIEKLKRAGDIFEPKRGFIQRL